MNAAWPCGLSILGAGVKIIEDTFSHLIQLNLQAAFCSDIFSVSQRSKTRCHPVQAIFYTKDELKLSYTSATLKKLWLISSQHAPDGQDVKGVFRECSGELALLLLLRDLLDTKQNNEIPSLMSTTFWVI